MAIDFPLEYNPDENGNRRPIEKEKLAQTQKELWEEFRGVTIAPESEHQALKGFWLDESDQLSMDKVLPAIVYVTDINKADHILSASNHYL